MKRLVPLIIVLALGVAAYAVWPRGVAPAPDPTEADIARAASLRPQNPALAEIFDRSCATCHATPDAMAPLVGHAAGWAPRLAERGADGLLHSVRNGHGNMPAMGLCFDCTDAEFRALIAFMSDTGDTQ